MIANFDGVSQPEHMANICEEIDIPSPFGTWNLLIDLGVVIGRSLLIQTLNQLF
jgi:hypothetical protein